MILTEKEYKAFITSHIELLFYVGIQSKIIEDKMDFKGFVNSDMEIKMQCRKFFLENPTLLDNFIHSKANFKIKYSSTLAGFKKAISSNFVIFKCLTKHAIFIDTKNNKFYAVKALADRFDVFFDHFPILVEATILPFNGQLIYDGFMETSGIHFGPKMFSTMEEDYKLAKKKNQIIKIF